MADANPELPTETDDNPETPVDVVALKKRRTTLRRKITGHCNQIEALIRDNKSRNVMRAMLKECLEAFNETEAINEQILDSLDEEDEEDEEAAKEAVLQAKYTSRITETSEAIQAYCVQFPDDASQPAGEKQIVAPGSRAQSAVVVGPNIQQGSRAPSVRCESVISDNSHKSSYAADIVSNLSQHITNFLAKAIENVFNRTRPPNAEPIPGEARTPKGRVFEWLHDQESIPEAPDSWIDLYVNGEEPPNQSSKDCSRHHSATSLEPYSGSALEWFQWVDLFRSLVYHTRKSPGEKLAILRRSLRGDCVDIVYGLGGGESAYKSALIRLKDSCGRRDVMRAAHIQAIERPEVGKTSTTFKRFAERVRTHFFDLSRTGGSSQRDIIERVTAKFSIQYRLAWNEGCSSGAHFHELERFGAWLCSRAAAYQNAYDIAAEQDKAPKEMEKRVKGRTHSASAETPKIPKSTGCWSCGSDHRLEGCPKFLGLQTSDRMKFAGDKRLCYACLRGKHPSKDCRTGKECGLNGCKKRHHRLLHRDEATVDATSAHASRTHRDAVALGVMSVRVLYAQGGRVKANLLIDEGSDTCLIQSAFLKRLGFSGDRGELRLHGVGGKRSNYRSERTEIQIEGENGLLSVTASSVPTVCKPTEKVEWVKLKSHWAHLMDLPLYDAGGEIHILIGSDHIHLLTPIETRRGKKGEPGAIRTEFGWVARGVVDPEGQSGSRVNLIQRVYGDLDDSFRRFCETESFGTEHSSGPALSKEDLRAVQVVDQGTKWLDPGYEVTLPWRDGEPKLKNNRAMADQRFGALHRKFSKDSDYKEDYKEAIAKYVAQGYAHQVTQKEELHRPDQYFLPHHGVYKKSAKGKKLRVVFDSAAKCDGKCLNDALLPGPALQADIPTVFFRFREYEVAFAADIEAMFSRIRHTRRCPLPPVPVEGDGSRDLRVYQMDRLAFGDCCSPFIAIRTVRRTAEDFGRDFPEAATAAKENLYMNDYLDSSATESHALEKIQQITELLRKGDFHLGKWVSNRPLILRSIDGGNSVDEVSGSVEHGSKILGVLWLPSQDVLTAGIATSHTVTFTRRGLLKIMAEVFDPMGFLAPVTVKAKVKHRELGIGGLDWDEEIPLHACQWWQEWLVLLEELKRAEIPRCLFPDEPSIDRVELHTFGDASQEAVAAVVYVRTVYRDRRIRTNLVMAKTKLTPMKTISVAKAELNAALLGSRLANYVQRALRRVVDRRILWTDSSCVRNWIRGTSSFYKPFVSNRIGEIQTLTRPDEWRYVPGSLNSSDLATRSSLDIDLASLTAWFKGPEFLGREEETWPKDIPWIVISEEIRPIYEDRCLVSSGVPVDGDWESVKPEDCAGFRTLTDPLKTLIKACQSQAFGAEIGRLRDGANLAKDSKVHGLNPFIDSDGLLRVGGRLQAADLPFENKHPLLLPSKHPLSERIVRDYHRRLLHAGVNHVLAHLRETYWVTNGREAVKRVRRSCDECKVEVARPATQIMGNLPPERLEVSPPFTYTSVDYFGPMKIIQANNRVAKRYGALFTCMVTRAVHLDLARSLSSDDFLLVLRSFIATQGKPLSMYSDNGTNFVGAEKELNQLVETTNEDGTLKRFCEYQGIRWKFQPPQAPHFGGVHESLVKSAKRALYKVLEVERENQNRVTEEVLRTLLFEIAGFMNGRPLTYVSSDPKDLRAITPNDFLNQRSSSNTVPMGEIAECNPRKQYRYLRRMIAILWDVWKKYYTPTLTSRSKWRTPKRSFQVGDAVLVLEPNLIRGKWLHGRVTEAFQGADGHIRSATVETEDGTYHRPIHKLSLLDPAPSCEDSEQLVGAPRSCSGGSVGARNAEGIRGRKINRKQS